MGKSFNFQLFFCICLTAAKEIIVVKIDSIKNYNHLYYSLYE